jgi:predicted DNA-binding protein
MTDKDKSIKNMSIAIDKEMKEIIELAAKKTGKSNSSLVRHIVEKYIDLEVNEGEKINLVLQIPIEFKSKDKEVDLRAWLQTKTDEIVKALTKN